MDRSEYLAALAKATITTTVGTDGLLNPTQSRAFLEIAQDSSTFGSTIRTEFVDTPSGEINKLNTGKRLLRAAVENADDGYRVEPTFPTLAYDTVKMRLPFEVTNDELEQNIEKRALEDRLVRRFGNQLGLDLDDLDINGDTGAGAGPDQAFLQLHDGLLIWLETNTSGDVNRVDASTINSGAIDKAHFFAGARAMPQVYRSERNRWFMSPNKHLEWIEGLTDRITAAGDAALGGSSGPGNSPLSYPIIEVPFFPDDRIIYADPQVFVRIFYTQVKRYFVGPQTDWELATRDKNGYIFFVRQGFYVAEDAAVVDLYDFDA